MKEEGHLREEEKGTRNKKNIGANSSQAHEDWPSAINNWRDSI